MSKMFVLTGTSGSYSDTYWGVVAVAHTRLPLQQLIKDLNALSAWKSKWNAEKDRYKALHSDEIPQIPEPVLISKAHLGTGPDDIKHRYEINRKNEALQIEHAKKVREIRDPAIADLIVRAEQFANDMCPMPPELKYASGYVQYEEYEIDEFNPIDEPNQVS